VARFASLSRTAFLLVVALAAQAPAVRAWAVPASESLLPATSKLLISTQDVDEVRAKFKETQLGQLVNDPVMKPFIDDLKEQIGAKLEKAGKKLGLKWADMEGVYAGEVALAMVQPDAKDKASHATVLLVDITGKRDKADALLAKVDANQKTNKAIRSALKAGGVEMVVYSQPLEAGQKVADKAYYYIKDDVLVATDHATVATEIAGRFGGAAKDSLATLGAFKSTMALTAQAAGGGEHHLRWFVEPFGYAEVSRAIQGGRRKRGNDMLKILKEQGFTGIQGVGGNIAFATGNEEILHRTYVYAPPAAGKMGEHAKDRYSLAMRMLQFPNSVKPTDLDPQAWVMPDVASYLTFNWDMRNAFEMSKTLVDAIAGDEGVFDDIWLSLETDPNGPKINIRKELIDHLAQRVTVMSDVKLPVDAKSERLMFLVEVNKPDIVAKALDKAFKADPAAKKRMTKDGHTIWELTQEEGIAEDATDFQIEGAGFVSKDEKKDSKEVLVAAEEEEEDPVLPNMALTVFQGHLIVSTHVEYIVEFLDRFGKGGPDLAGTPEFKQVDAAMKRLQSSHDSFRFFTRTDEAYRATYELIKQNKLPQSETMLARMLNAMFKPAEEGAIRKQAIDGTKLPAYEMVMKYFGPGGFYVQSERDGWLVVGCLLKKEAK
jgi:hypothetical protein